MPDNLVRYPFSHDAFPPFTVFAAACHLLMLVGVLYLARGRTGGRQQDRQHRPALRHRRPRAAVRVRMGAAAVRRSAHLEHRTLDRRRRIRPGHAAARRRHDRGRRRHPAPADLGVMAPVRAADLRATVAGRDPHPVHRRRCGSGSPCSAPATCCWAWRSSATAPAAPTTRSRSHEARRRPAATRRHRDRPPQAGGRAAGCVAHGVAVLNRWSVPRGSSIVRVAIWRSAAISASMSSRVL